MPHFIVNRLERRAAGAWRTFVESGRDTIEWPVGCGARMRLDKGSMLSKGIVTGEFERGERRVLPHLLSSGGSFLDVGANIGVFTVIAGKIVGQRGRVVALEPSPSTARTLRAQIDLNALENVTVLECGLSDRAGVLSLWQSSAGLDALNTFGRPLEAGEFDKVDVPTRTLDEVVETELRGIPPNLIKIDVEGWEPCVLAGGKNVLSRSDTPNLMVEFCEATLNHVGSACEELFEKLRSAGFRLYIINQYHGNLHPWNAPAKLSYANVLATKREVPRRLITAAPFPARMKHE